MCYQLQVLPNPENIVSKKSVFVMILRKSQEVYLHSSCTNSFQKFDENILSAKALHKFVARERGYLM